MFMTFGVDFTFLFGRVLRADDFARYTSATSFSFFDLFVWVSFYYRGGNGYHFQGSRGGNDTRLHCLALLNILGCFLFCYLLLCSSFTDCFCTWNLGIGEQRFLATGMWLVGSGSETMGCGVVSV